MFREARHEITPAMKVGDLLREYPELEERLISLSPLFVKLKNPVLRRTIARVASLRQASVVGGLVLADMINTLRTAAGQETLTIQSEQNQSYMSKPNWLTHEKIVISLDARPILASGDHPLDKVLRETRSMNPGEIYEIITPFPPAPMVEKMMAAGFDTYMEPGDDGLVRSYFRKV